MKKTTQLKQLLASKDLSFLMEAHNGLSARLAQETGFKGLWASGLSISASLGVRDNNEASWTQVVDVLEFMSDATQIPILLDGDTGYGNFNNVRRLIKKLEQRDVAGVCIEDKLFPKTNSFLNGHNQVLADVAEFCGKIKAAKDTQLDADFSVVARTEAFIVELGITEALDRASAYAQAGADAILVHSKKATADDICAFMAQWSGEVPIVIVPTKYYATPTMQFRQMGISTIIWANHAIRSAIAAMKKTMHVIHDTQTLKEVEPHVVSVAEVFRLQGADELAKAESQYLPGHTKSISAVILAAGASRVDGMAGPKSMLTVDDKSILGHQVDALVSFGIGDVTVVRGHQKQAIQDERCVMIDNDAYQATSEVYSLYLATSALQSSAIISYGDILYKHYYIHDCLAHGGDIVIVVDVQCPKQDRWRDYIQASCPFEAHNFHQNETLVRMDRQLDDALICGEFVGLIKTTKAGSQAIVSVLNQLSVTDIQGLSMADWLTMMTKTMPVHVLYVQGGWVDVNTLADWQKAVVFRG